MKQFFSCESSDLLCSHSNGDIFTCENNMLFSRVKISCFRAKAHLVFHWCLYNKLVYDLIRFNLHYNAYNTTMKWIKKLQLFQIVNKWILDKNIIYACKKICVKILYVIS